MYKNIEEVIGTLYLSGYWSILKKNNLALMVEVMYKNEMTVSHAVKSFPEQFKPCEE